MTDMAFLTATVGLFQPAQEFILSDPYGVDVADTDGDTVGSPDDNAYEFTWGAVPWGSLSMDVRPTETTGALYLSDIGYTTKSTDAGGTVVYPPKLSAPVSIDRQIPLPPGDGAGTWAFGELEVTDTDNAVSSLLRSWSIDAQNLTINRGVKTYEAFDGYRSGRLTKGWYIDLDGVLQEAAAGVVRWDYSTGTRTLLNEDERTNSIANPRAEGAVAGTPGTAPTGWSISAAASGITCTIVAIGDDAGIPKFDFQISGTALATATFQVNFMNTTAIPALVGETWTASVYGKLLTGDYTGVTTNLNVAETGGSSTPSTSQAFTATGDDLYTQRTTVTRTITTADNTHIRSRVLFAVTNGATVDITLRIGAPQLEEGATASSVILPPISAQGASTRDMERLYTARNIWTSPALATLEPVFTGISGMWIAADNAVRIPIRDISYWLDRPIQTSVYVGSGAYDGTSELAGVSLPKLRGTAYNITPVLIDPTNQIYQYNDAAGTVVALYERGAAVIEFQANTTDLYTGTTNPGEYRTDNSRGLFQLGSAPVGQITLDATGEFPAAGARNGIIEIARYLQSEDASVPAAFIDTEAYEAASLDVAFSADYAAGTYSLTSSYPFGGGIYIPPGSGMTGRAAVAYMLSSYGAKLIVGRNGKSRPLVLRATSLTATPVMALNEYNTISVRAVELPSSLHPPPYRIRCGYQHNYTLQPDISATATDAHREFVQQSDRFKTSLSADIQATYRLPNDLPPFGGALDSATDAATVASEIADLWCAQRFAYLVRVPIEIGLDLDLGDTVLLTWPDAFLRLGQRGLIVREQFRSNEDITFMVLV